MELLAGVDAVERGDATNESAGLRRGVFAGQELRVETELAQIVHDEGRPAHRLVAAPTPKERGLAASKEATEDGHGQFRRGAHRNRVSIHLSSRGCYSDD